MSCAGIVCRSFGVGKRVETGEGERERERGSALEHLSARRPAAATGRGANRDTLNAIETNVLAVMDFTWRACEVAEREVSTLTC